MVGKDIYIWCELIVPLEMKRCSNGLTIYLDSEVQL